MLIYETKYDADAHQALTKEIESEYDSLAAKLTSAIENSPQPAVYTVSENRPSWIKVTVRGRSVAERAMAIMYLEQAGIYGGDNLQYQDKSGNFVAYLGIMRTQGHIQGHIQGAK